MHDPKARRVPDVLCPRDYCALYRSAPIREFGLKFSITGPGYRRTAAERMFVQLEKHGYHGHVFDTVLMMQYMEHVAHATAGLQPEQRHLNHSRTQKRVERKLRKFFNSPLIKDLAQSSD